MGRPETISCERCNTSVVVKAKGPVPSFCADCRRKRSRNGHTRPAVVNCERCEREVVVQSRGPVPRFCRDGCQPASAKPAGDVTPAVTSTPAVAVAVSPPALRPWDRASKSKPAKGPSRPAPAATRDSPQPVTPAFSSSTVTRIDIAHPATMVGSADIGRRLRIRRLRQAGAGAVWLAIIVIIALILFVGSQPAAPDFDSYARLIA